MAAAAAGGRGGVSGNKFRMALALPVGAVMNCGDNTGRHFGIRDHSLCCCALIQRANSELSNLFYGAAPVLRCPGAKNLYVIAVSGTGARLNRLPAASVGDYVLATVKKGKPELRKKGESESTIVFSGAARRLHSLTNTFVQCTQL
jgi:hypothetical protein